ncbi:hypothetical protein CTA2_9661, partial [Colletotrichum tanaceti]
PDSKRAVIDKPHRSGEKCLVKQAVHIPRGNDYDDDPDENENEPPRRELLRIYGCRLVGLTERNSSVMKVSEIEEYAGHDPIIKAFGGVFAVRLGLQLAQNKNLDVDVVDASAAADPDVAEANMQFVRTRYRIHGSVAGRVAFSKLDPRAAGKEPNTTAAAIVAGLASLQVGEKRSTTQQQGTVLNTLDDSSVVDPRKTLGPVAAEFVFEVQKTGAAKVSLLVVQAKRPAEDPNALQRKASVDRFPFPDCRIRGHRRDKSSPIPLP